MLLQNRWAILKPKESDLLKENIRKNEIKKLDLHGFSLIEANKIVKNFIINSFNEWLQKTFNCNWQRIEIQIS